MLEIGPGEGLPAAKSLRGDDGSTQRGTRGTLHPHPPTVTDMSPEWIPTHSRKWDPTWDPTWHPRINSGRCNLGQEDMEATDHWSK